MHSYFLPSILIILALLSLVTLKSIAPDLARPQLVFWILGFGVFLFFSKINLKIIKKYHWVSFSLLILMLIITLIQGNLTRGAARWIKFGNFFAIQPSQLAIPLAGLTASFYGSKINFRKIKSTLKFLFILFVPGLLILVEPDLGTTLVYLISTSIIIPMTNIKKNIIWLLLISIVLSGLVAWSLVLKPYQKSRLTSFLSPEKEQSSASYNAYQSQIAVGSGQLLGKGLGHGSQSHLRFLPEHQTDFIFASFAEEWGFVGSVILVGIYASTVWYLIYKSLSIKTRPHAYYLLITLTMMSFQTIVNIGMNIGLLPITGVTLPLMSYGGSSLLSICLMLGICHNIVNLPTTKAKLNID